MRAHVLEATNHPPSTDRSKITLEVMWTHSTTLPPLYFLVLRYFPCKRKRHAVFALCRCKKEFPILFFPWFAGTPFTSHCWKWRQLLRAPPAPPAHRRLHLVLQAQIILGKRRRGAKRQADNNCCRFLSCLSKVRGLSCPCVPRLALARLKSTNRERTLLHRALHPSHVQARTSNSTTTRKELKF